MSYRNIICDVIFFPLDFKSSYYENNDKWNANAVPKYFSNMGEASVPKLCLKWNGLFRSSAAERLPPKTYQHLIKLWRYLRKEVQQFQ